MPSPTAPSPVSGFNNATPLRLGMVAGEASGDVLAALLLQSLQHAWPLLQAQGIGGPRMVEAGFVAQWPSEKLSVFGYLDALRVYRSLVKVRNELANQMIQSPPHVFVGIDAPDFNFGLERLLKDAGIKTLHVVCPSFWAWRPGRLASLSKSVDHVLCLFPFEPPLLAAHGINATYIGHPLASEVPAQPDKVGARMQLGLTQSDTVIALLPGSRVSEVAHIGPVVLDTALLLLKQYPHMKFVVPTTEQRWASIAKLVDQKGLSDHVSIIPNGTHVALAAADTAVVASGTATLEAALLKCPMVIVYKLNRLSWWMLKRMHLQPWVGLPNILAREFIVPELLQDAAHPQAIANEVLSWLDDPARVLAVKERFQHLHTLLKQDTGAIAAKVIGELIYA